MRNAAVPRVSLLLVLTVAGVGCGGPELATTESARRYGGATVAVAVAPVSPVIAASATLTFSATVTGAADPSVRWSVAEGSAGGAVTAAGVYTAPAAAGTYHVVAVSNADRTKKATATVTVTAPPQISVAVAIAPATGTVDACQSLAFSASVTGAPDASVTWSVLEGDAGGTVSSAGVYTAPASAGTYHVVARSQADPSKAQSAIVTVTERIVSVQVNPASVTATAGGTVQFTATVTTSCGAFTQAGSAVVAMAGG